MKYLISELWGSLFKEDIEIEAKDRKTALKKYLERHKGKKVVYDNEKNYHLAGSVFVIREGHYDNGIKYSRGKRSFYKICYTNLT